MTARTPKIDGERLRALLEGVNDFGFNRETGGYNRTGYSAADSAVRDWFLGQMHRDGLAVERDGANNLFGRYGPASGPCVMSGSHLDTVPEGGPYDGALGACVALECARAMRDANFEPQTALTVVATAEEEGRFGGMLGSQAIAGTVTRGWIEQAADADGIRLVDAMASQGLDPWATLDAAWPAASIRAFLELHIEQGPVLEQSGRPVGIAHGVSGVCNLQVVLEGVANHSGTTPMDMRADAFAGLAEIAHGIPDLIAETGGDQSRITIGKVDLAPNFAHTVPGKAAFSIIIRDVDEILMRQLRAGMEKRIADCAKAHGLTFTVEEKSWLSPVLLDPDLCRTLHEEARAMGLDPMDMPSGAGHDAQTMQGLCPSALVFVPSRGGISHAPQEWTNWSDIERGAQLMLNALVRLCA